MSLVGSLEDLGLGDILQIVSLSRKSGLLLLRSDAGEGRIVLCDGLVRAAFVKGQPEDLRGILVGGGFLAESDFDACARAAAESGRSQAELVADRTGLTGERLDSLRREHVERAVLRMFTWRSGEFSFEVRDEVAERDRELLLPTGINAQYLIMEATRLGDESGEPDSGIAAADAPPTATDEGGPTGTPVEDDAPMFSGEDAGEAPVSGTVETPPAALPEPPAPEPIEAHEVVALAAARGAEDEPEALPAPLPAAAGDAAVARPVAPSPPVPAPAASAGAAVALVAIDPDLAALEWLKASLAELFGRVHIFQDSDRGMARIRQYLARAERPVVLLADRAPGDGLAGSDDAASLARRLKTLAPSMPVLALHAAGDAASGLPGCDAAVPRPPTYELAERKRWSRLEPAAQELRAALAPWAARCAAAPAAATRPPTPPAPPADLARLKQMSALLRDPSARGDVLARVLEYASEFFARVAIFMVRDDTAQGIAQIGLPRAGGPDDEGLQRLELPVRETEGVREVIAEREARRFAPGRGAGPRLAERLGDRIPAQAYLAPIESGGRVAALLYADNLPDGSPVGDTTALEIVLHEAGLALDRALLERALAEVEALPEGDVSG